MELKRLSLTERMNYKTFSEMKFINSSHKLPIILVLDTSGSMQYENNIGKLNEGVKKFYESVIQDEEASLYTEICVVTFGKDGVDVQSSFGGPKQQTVPTFEAGGSSPLCSALLMGLDLLEDQIDLYNEKGLQIHPPVLITLTDGEPTTLQYRDGVPVLLTNEMEEYKIAKERFDYFKNKMGLDAYTIYFGDDIEDTFFLNEFASTPKNVKKMEDVDIVNFFSELGQSTSLLSKLAPTGDSQLIIDYDIFQKFKNK